MKRREMRFILLACVLYFVCLLARTDLSAVMLDIIQKLKLQKDQLGVAVTGGYIAYAMGMIMNSLIAERGNPKKMICIAMFGCALTHFGIKCFPIFPVILILWCINGYLQSMIWPSLIQTMGLCLSEKQRTRAMSVVTIAQHAGSVACYLLVPVGLSCGGWGTVMLATAAVCLTVSFAWGLSGVTSVCENTKELVSTSPCKLDRAFLAKTGLPILLILGVLTGMLRDGITTWAPVYYAESFSLEAATSILLTAMLPACKILACVVCPFVLKWVSNVRKALLCFYSVILVAALVLLFSNRVGMIGLSLLMMNLILLMSGCISILYIITLPFYFSATGRSATLSGFLDCSLYAGAAVSSSLFAFLQSGFGWPSVILSWGGLAAVGICIVLADKQLALDIADSEENKNLETAADQQVHK